MEQNLSGHVHNHSKPMRIASSNDQKQRSAMMEYGWYGDMYRQSTYTMHSVCRSTAALVSEPLSGEHRSVVDYVIQQKLSDHERNHSKAMKCASSNG